MRTTRRNLLQAATIICTIVVVFTLVWKPVAVAQRDPKSGADNKINTKFDIQDPGMIDVSTLDVAHLGPPIEPNAWEKPAGRHVETGEDLDEEEEPNGAPGTATPLSATEGRIEGNIRPNGDVDYYSFAAPSAGRLYAATQTTSSANGEIDSVIDVLGSDGATVLENDDNDGSFSSLSSSIAGVNLPSAGVYFIRVRHASAALQLRPYFLYFAFRNVAPLAETGAANNTPATAQPLGSASEVNGAVSPAADVDFYSMALSAGDTVFMSLNIDPERDNVQWNGRLGFGLFGSGSPSLVLVSNDTRIGSAANPLSEEFFFTVKDAGTFFAYVDEPAAGGGAGNTYTLSITVFPANSNPNCTTYASTDVPKVIPTGPGLVSSNIVVPPGSGRIDSAQVLLTLTHTFMQDLDVNLVSPRANDNGLFTDIGAGTVGGPQTGMNMWVDDDAAIPPFFAITEDFRIQPEIQYRLEYLNGEDPTGTWRLDIRDDVTGGGGNLTGWSLRICEVEEPAPGRTTIFATDFESDNGGFTHSGTLDEWEYGTPNTAATSTVNPVASFRDCGSGTKCWKTDLDNTYDSNSSQNLDSPQIVIPADATEVELSWMMRYQFESATSDHAWIEVRPVGNPSGNKIVGEWGGSTMVNSVGDPAVNIGQSAGWGLYSAGLSDFAGQTVVVRFHVDSDPSINLGGLAVDDVKITSAASAAVPVIVSGRLETSGGRGIAKGRVVLTEQNGTQHLAISSTFGYFQFESVLSQQNVTVSASSKRYTFSPVSLSLNGNVHTVMTGTPVP